MSKDLHFPMTIQQLSKATGIPERTLRKYCEDLGVKKFGKNYMIFYSEYKDILLREEENRAWHKADRGKNVV